MIRYIAALDLAQNQLHGRNRWRAIAATLGFDIRQYIGQPSFADIEAFIRGAAGLWLYNTAFLRDPNLSGSIHKAIEAGARCLVEVNSNELRHFNEFLGTYGLEATRMALHSVTPSSLHPRLVNVERATHAEVFHHPILFDGVESVLLQQAQVLLCHARARPVLSVPLSDVEIVDIQSDLFKDLDAREVSVLGADADHGRIIAMTASCFGDGYLGPTGESFPGIDANTQLTTNTLRWLGGDQAPASLVDADAAFRLIDRIEGRIARYLRAVLTRVHADWWTDGVPETIRVDCSARRERERNLLERHCYLDLMHWKEVAGGNWEHIEADWRRAGWSGNKKAGLGWFNELNAIRNVVMHPTKRAFGSEMLTAEHLAFLRSLKEQVDTLPLSPPVEPPT